MAAAAARVRSFGARSMGAFQGDDNDGYRRATGRIDPRSIR
jgi:hypothetical protein